MLSPYSGSDQAGQMGMLQDVTAREDVSAIILISFDEKSLAPLVEEATKAGKAVVIINSDIKDYPTPVHGVIGVNQRDANHKLYDWAKQQLGDAPRKVAVLEGQPGLPQRRTQRRLQGRRRYRQLGHRLQRQRRLGG